MGNKIARTTQVSASEYYLHELPSSYNLVLVEVLGRGRFLKSILCKHDEGLVLVKVYFKRGDPLNLKEHERRLAEIRDIFRTVQHPHIWPFQFWMETDKAAYLLRQYFFSNLHERLTTRPFLSLIEKKWLAFQLLCAVKQSHENGVCHGDIKCENVLVTSWNWLYLADFASFKPTYIPDDDPSDFSFFFDTGGRRRCYLAPERFFEHGSETQFAPDAALKPSMDIFSLGCVIAELFLEAQPLFELSQLLAYRRGQYDPSQHLEKIQDAGIRKMILHMIQLDPESRLSCESYLQTYASLVFPSYFSPFLHKFFSCLVPLDTDARVAVTQSAFNEIYKQLSSNLSNEEISSESCADTNSRNIKCSQFVDAGQCIFSDRVSCMDEKHKLLGESDQLVGDISSLLRAVEERNHGRHTKARQENPKCISLICSDSKFELSNNRKQYRPQSSSQLLQTISQYKDNEKPLLGKILDGDLNSLMAEYNSQTDIYGLLFFPGMQSKLRCEGMALISSLICSCIRSVKQPQLRRTGVLLLKSSSAFIDDEDRLQHVLPYVIALLSDPASIVRCAALETLCDILSLVQDFPPSERMIFPEYILPMLSMLPDDPEESVRICYASNIFKVALTAYRVLVQSQSSTQLSSVEDEIDSVKALAKKDAWNINTLLSQLRKSVAEVVQELVMGPKQTPNIRRALLQDIGHLCYFFGQKQCNNFLLPILPAFLNDRDEQLRAAFYRQIVFVCYFVGQTSVEEYLLPYIEQALSDTMEAVIVNALKCLTTLCRSMFLRKRKLLDMIERAFPLLCYPILWVRRSAVTFIATCSESLGPVDSYVYISPVLRPFVYREPASLSSEMLLLSCLKPPVSKPVFYEGLKNVSSDMLERQRKIWYNASTYPNQLETIEHYKRAGVLNPLCSSGTKEPNSHAASYEATSFHKYSPKSDAEDVCKLRIASSLHNTTSRFDIREPIGSERLQVSGFISPYVASGNSVLCDRPSEGIPVYSFCADKSELGVAASGYNLNSWGVGSSSMSLLDTVNKQYALSNSVPPKLTSGSLYNISNSSKQTIKLAQNPEGRDNEQSTYINSKFQDVATSDTLKGSSLSGDDASLSDASELPSFSRTSTTPDKGWRPRGVLVAHLQEHRSAINDIAISNDHSFFATASDDSTIKIWDTRKLEKDISFKSRLTYPLDGSKALRATMLRGTAQVVVGTSSGVIHLLSIDYISRGLGSVVERYSGIADLKNKDAGEGAITSILNCCALDSCINQTLLYSTQRCGIHLWDTRVDSVEWTFKSPPEEGYISSLVIGQCGNWFVSGTSRGVLTLWDMRFLLPVNSWQYSSACPVEGMCLLIPPSDSMFAIARPFIYVAAGCNEVSLWNAENGSCHQVFRIASTESGSKMITTPWALAQPSTKSYNAKGNFNSNYRTTELNEPSPRLPGIRMLYPLPGGDLLTGGTDLRIRYWDHSSPDRSYYVCGPSEKGVENKDYYDIRSCSGVQVVQEIRRQLENKLKNQKVSRHVAQKAPLAMAATDSAGCHQDSVISLASVKLNQRLLISGSRDGTIKVWK